MPIYEYRCTSCGHELEALQKLSDAPLTECPACKASALSKKVSAAGFQLKGSGWYVTDFRNSGAKASPTKDGKAGTEAKTSGETKSDAKSETTNTTTTSNGGSTETKSTTTVSSDKSGS
jgi:putative FmdB family regulatory protein